MTDHPKKGMRGGVTTEEGRVPETVVYNEGDRRVYEVGKDTHGSHTTHLLGYSSHSEVTQRSRTPRHKRVFGCEPEFVKRLFQQT